MKLGILGGTFNPVHLGHLHLAGELAHSLALDRVLLIPTWIPPHKQTQDLAPSENRLEMCRLAVSGNPLYDVCDYEVRARGTSYTYRTLEHLQKQYPDARLHLLMGADMFLTIQDWRAPERIWRAAVLCAAERRSGETARLHEHARMLEKKGAQCRIVELSAKPMSSTQIRECLHAGQEVSQWLDPRVYAYIREKGLYAAI